MSPEQKIGLCVLLAAAAFWLPSRIDQARRNHRARKARQRIRGSVVSTIDAMVQQALEEGDEALCFERWERQMEGSA